MNDSSHSENNENSSGRTPAPDWSPLSSSPYAAPPPTSQPSPYATTPPTRQYALPYVPPSTNQAFPQTPNQGWVRASDGNWYPAPSPPSSEEPVWGLVSIICGAAGFILGPLVSICGIVFAVIGKKENRQKGFPLTKPKTGFWLSVGSLAYFVAMFLFVFLLVFVLAFTMGPSDKTIRSAREASTAANAYWVEENTYDGLTPAKLRNYGYVPEQNIKVGVYPQDGDLICVDVSTTTVDAAHVWSHAGVPYVQKKAGTTAEITPKGNNVWEKGICNVPEATAAARLNAQQISSVE